MPNMFLRKVTSSREHEFRKCTLPSIKSQRHSSFSCKLNSSSCSLLSKKETPISGAFNDEAHALSLSHPAKITSSPIIPSQSAQKHTHTHTNSLVLIRVLSLFVLWLCWSPSMYLHGGSQGVITIRTLQWIQQGGKVGRGCTIPHRFGTQIKGPSGILLGISESFHHDLGDIFTRDGP